MKMQQCPHGHFYDTALYETCPYCSPANDGSGRTLPLDGGTGTWSAPAASEAAFTSNPIFDQGQDNEAIGKTVAVINGFESKRDEADNKTVAITPGKKTSEHAPAAMAVSPVVGWLVCNEGKDKGRDYRIFNGNNSVGRGAGVKISIEHDETISRENMATIAYDEKSNVFFLIAGTGTNVIRLNSKLLPASQASELHAYDRIELGHTTLVFVPFCGESFEWME